MQGLSTVSTISSTSSRSNTEGWAIFKEQTEDDKVGEVNENENIKDALKSMMRVLFLTKEEDEGGDTEIGEIIDNFVDNIGGSLDLSSNDVFESRNKSKNCAADPIPKSEIVSNRQSLAESVCTFVDYFPCKYCPVILNSRNKLWQHFKSH